MATDGANAPDTIVLVHGLWLTPLSWEKWIDHYKSKGYNVLAPAWPGMEGDIEQVRSNTKRTRTSGSRKSPTTTSRSSEDSTSRRSSWATRSAA